MKIKASDEVRYNRFINDLLLLLICFFVSLGKVRFMFFFCHSCERYVVGLNDVLIGSIKKYAQFIFVIDSDHRNCWATK